MVAEDGYQDGYQDGLQDGSRDGLLDGLPESGFQEAGCLRWSSGGFAVADVPVPLRVCCGVFLPAVSLLHVVHLSCAGRQMGR